MLALLNKLCSKARVNGHDFLQVDDLHEVLLADLPVHFVQSLLPQIEVDSLHVRLTLIPPEDSAARIHNAVLELLGLVSRPLPEQLPARCVLQVND